MDIQELLKNKSLLEAAKSEKLEAGAKKQLHSMSATLPSGANKAAGVSDNAKKIAIEIVANTPLYLDSDKDVVMPDAFDTEGTEIPLIDTHNKSSIRSIISWGKLSYKSVSLKDLGLDGEGMAKTLVFNAEVSKKSSPVEFEKYSDNLIRQHSLSFLYLDLQLAANDEGEDWVENKALWDEVYPQLLNKEDADKLGYFWVVRKGLQREVSSCVFGACKITPTLSVEETSESQKSEKKTFFNYKN